MPAVLAVTALLVAYVPFALPMALRAPFHADDLIFLERTRGASFLWLWQTADVPFGYWRPWSREFAFWLLQQLFGPHELPFHVVSIALFALTLGMFYSLARRLSGPLPALAATFGAAAMAAWGTPLIWISGFQDLWMLCFAMAALLFVSRGRIAAATLFTALAFLSKESALVLPAVAAAYATVIERRNPFAALWRVAPLWLVALAWTFVHPLVAARLYHHAAAAAPAGPWVNPIAGSMLLQAAMSLVNLDAPIKPILTWKTLAYGAAVPMAVLAVPTLIVALRSGRRRGFTPMTGAPPAAAIGFGAAWAILGWLPLLQPPLTWHAYYGLFGALGAWLALGTLMARARWLAPPLLAAMVFLALAQAATPSLDLGTAFYQIRASNFVLMTRNFLLAQEPMPAGSRIYLAQVPGSVGLIPWEQRSIAPQLWTGDTTLAMYYVSHYKKREPADSIGRDFMYTYDNKKGWSAQAIVVPTAASTPGEVERYSTFLWSIGRFAEARPYFEELVARFPGEWTVAHNLGSCYLQMKDSVMARQWFDRAIALRDAPVSPPPAAAPRRPPPRR